MIRKHEQKDDSGHITYIRQVDGIYDLNDLADKRIAKGNDHLGNSSLSGSFSFTGTESLAEAVHLSRYGWPEGTEGVAAVADKLSVDDSLLKSAQRIDTFLDVAGDEPDIDAYLEGSPDNMINYVQDQQNNGKILDLVVNVTQHASVDKKEIENRGAAILVAVEALRSHGYSIGIFAVEQCSPTGYGSYYDKLRYEIPILEPGQAINVDTLAFSLMHPSFLRRLIFAAQEAETDDLRQKFGITVPGGYGMPISIKGYEHVRPSYIIDKDDGLYRSRADAGDFAQKIVEKSLEVLSA